MKRLRDEDEARRVAELAALEAFWWALWWACAGALAFVAWRETRGAA